MKMGSVNCNYLPYIGNWIIISAVHFWDNRRCVLNIDIYLASKNAVIEFCQAQTLLNSGASLYVAQFYLISALTW